jgi:alpha-mannosidase
MIGPRSGRMETALAIKEILFVHHSHTDIGYTHPQPVVMELHRRFIDEALDIAERTADYPDDAKFRWTCEVTNITVDWWKQASNRDRDRFLAAYKRGQIDVAGMGWHMTPLMDHSMVVDVLKPLKFLREEVGVAVRSAMNTDVNGLPWGVVDALLDHGITGISMAINEHYGHALKPWPRAFNWQAPGGRNITAYNGFIYGVTSDKSLRIPLDMDEARARVPAWAKRWEDGGYPHPFLMMQLTNVRYHDNASPEPEAPDFIRRFNEGNASNGGIKLRFGTISEFFDRVRQQPADTLPTLRGDWTDWWNFGAGSTAHETAQMLRGQRDLDAALSLEAWHPGKRHYRSAALHDRARDGLALYAEHTWGADRSISAPFSPETRTQQLLKLATAADGASVARMLRRDGLEALATEAGGEEPTLLIYNPHPFPVTQSIRLPYLPPMAGAPDPKRGFGLEDVVPAGPSSHRIQRQDVVLSDLSDDRAYWTTPIAVPALSYVTLPAAEVVPNGTDKLSAKDSVLSNGRVTATLDPKGGLTSLTLDGVEYAGAPAQDLKFGVPVLERIASGKRTDMFDQVDLESPDWHKAWHLDWQAVRAAPTSIAVTTTVVLRGSAEISQSFVLANGDKVEVIYRLLPDDPALSIEAVVTKLPLSEPHGIYLPMPAALKSCWSTDYETGGAILKLDDEQLPYASRHYITTQRFIRIADDAHELTVACPDAPLWQIGGFTFGRFGDPDGRVVRENPTLLAWLTNNYWSTNFQADQGGQTRFRFWLLPAAKQDIGAAAQGAITRVQPLAAHLYTGQGEKRSTAGTLLKTELGPVLLTRLEAEGNGVALSLLNPSDEAVEVTIGSGTVKVARAHVTSLAGAAGAAVPVKDGTVTATIAARAWTRLAVYPG